MIEIKFSHLEKGHGWQRNFVAPLPKHISKRDVEHMVATYIDSHFAQEGIVGEVRVK